MHHQVYVKKFYVLRRQCVYVFCVDLRRNSDYFPVQLLVVGFYNLDGVCLLRGTNWSLMYSLDESPSQIHRTMAHGVSRRLLTRERLVQYMACVVCVCMWCVCMCMVFMCSVCVRVVRVGVCVVCLVCLVCSVCVCAVCDVCMVCVCGVCL